MGVDVDISGVQAYRAEPAGPPRGALIVIHEAWGLVPHIAEVADRFAAEGYLAVAPDLLSNAGITPEVGLELERMWNEPDEAKRTEYQPILREKLSAGFQPAFAAEAVGKLRRIVDSLDAEPGVDGRIGVLGFCFGGTYSFALAVADERVRVAVPFYGAPPALDELHRIRGSVLALYGELDPRLMDSLPEVRRAMAEGGVDFADHVYPGARHAFFNDSSPSVYHAEAAADAWRRTLAQLEAKLG